MQGDKKSLNMQNRNTDIYLKFINNVHVQFPIIMLFFGHTNKVSFCFLFVNYSHLTKLQVVHTSVKFFAEEGDSLFRDKFFKAQQK